MTIPPRASRRKLLRRRLLAGGAAVIVVVALVWGLLVILAPVPEPVETAGPMETKAPEPTPSPTPTPTSTPTPFDRTAHSIDDPLSIWVVADKLRPLQPLDFYPPDLVTAEVRYSANATMRAEAATALERMFAVAESEGSGEMMVQNAFRAYDTQVWVYAGHVNRLGQARADIGSARPGHSEHQTGLSADIMPASGECAVTECFADTTQGRWLAENAWRFGFHLRYPQGKTDVTGYAFEPWHYRYVGVALSTELHLQGVLTLEEFFGLPPAPSYP